jgi:hypothetical protein
VLCRNIRVAVLSERVTAYTSSIHSSIVPARSVAVTVTAALDGAKCLKHA